MKSLSTFSDITMEDLIRRWPSAVTLLLEHHMACVGCSMAAFETLADAADVYGLSLERILGELQDAGALEEAGEASSENKEEEMSKVGQAIREHHSEILRILWERVAGVVEGEGKADPQGLVGFLKEDLLPHAAGEEKHMYPAVDPLVKEYGRSTATMTVDHEFIKRYIDGIEEATRTLQSAGPAERPAIEEHLRRLALKLEALLEVHLEKEERVYVPLFEEHLSEVEQQRILNGMHEAYEEGPTLDIKKTVDVRVLPPPQRHVLIFQTFEELQPGDAFLLVNDHDPRPLYYQFKYEREGEFTWEYLEQGPDVWRVRIGRAAGVKRAAS